MPARLLAAVDALLMDILRDALPEDVTVVEVLPADWAGDYPVVVACRLPGGAAVHPEFLDRALCQVDVYHDDRTGALELAGSCRTALYEAWKHQTVFPHGSVSQYSETAAPAALAIPNQPAGETFVTATYGLHISPPLVP